MTFGDVFKKCPQRLKHLSVTPGTVKAVPELRSLLLYACVDEQMRALMHIWGSAGSAPDIENALRAICNAGLVHHALDPAENAHRAVVSAAYHAFKAGAASHVA